MNKLPGEKKREFVPFLEGWVRESEVQDAFSRGARHGWMRAVVYHLDIDAEGDPNEIAEIERRWPLSAALPESEPGSRKEPMPTVTVEREHVAAWLRMWTADFDLEDKLSLHSSLHRGRGKIRFRERNGRIIDGIFKPFREDERCPLCPLDKEGGQS